MFKSVTAESRTPVRQNTISRSKPSKLVKTSAPNDRTCRRHRTDHPLSDKTEEEQDEGQPERQRIDEQHLLHRDVSGHVAILRGRQQVRQPVVVQRLAAKANGLRGGTSPLLTSATTAMRQVMSAVK